MKALIPMAMAVAALGLLPAAAVAQEETIVPRTYTADDCTELNQQIDASLEYSTIDDNLAASIRNRRVGADKACNSGDYANGARQLRRILDDIIAARGQ